MTLRTKALGATAVVLVAAISQNLHATAGTHHHGGHGLGHRRSVVLGYTRDQLGKPYVWGATGPDAFDCSGLAQQAFARAGIRIARVSQDQWSTGHKIPASQVKPGDEVFFAGSDGTAASPGHVGIVKNAMRHTMYEAYATGYPVRVSHYGTANSPAGDQVVVGFTDPFAGGA